LDIDSTYSLKQQSVGRYGASLEHIILIPGQQVSALSPYSRNDMAEKLLTWH
jgi:hypothetical protein